MQKLIDLDKSLFSFLNGIGSPTLDSTMLFLSDKYVWIPLYLILIGLLIYKYKIGFWLPLTYVLIVFAVNDQVTSGLMKPFFERLRPCHDPTLTDVVNIGRCGGRFGFASSHAANTVGLAASYFLLFGKRWWTITMLVWAALVSYSRIYLGVHFPGDILIGAAIGVISAFLFRQMIIILSRHTSLHSPFSQ